MSKWKERSRTWELEQIAKATRFTACAFLGSGKFDVRETGTLIGARQLKTEMDLEYKDTNYGRKTLIYAIVEGVGSILVE